MVLERSSGAFVSSHRAVVGKEFRQPIIIVIIGHYTKAIALVVYLCFRFWTVTLIHVLLDFMADDLCTLNMNYDVAHVGWSMRLLIIFVEHDMLLALWFVPLQRLWYTT